MKDSSIFIGINADITIDDNMNKSLKESICKLLTNSIYDLDLYEYPDNDKNITN